MKRPPDTLTPDSPTTAPSAAPAPPRTGWTRRGFLQTTASLGALAVTARATGQAEHTEQLSAPAALGPGDEPLVFTLNGETVSTYAEPRETLADVLLFRLGLTGTKVACDRGACGACTLLVDGTIRVSCMTPALDIADRHITTVEGLADKNGNPSPLQNAFVTHDAMQCGYCTPGFLIAATALTTKNPNPTRDQVVEAISGNLCRCAAHNHIVDAILSVAKRGQP